MKPFIIGVDACNIRQGGTLTHLIAFLTESDPLKHNFSKIIIWSNTTTLDKIPSTNWIEKKSNNMLNGSFLKAFYFQKFCFKYEAQKAFCNIVFVPGGAFMSSFRPFVTISQNMLPFEQKELYRYKNLKFILKFLLLKRIQSFTFKKADGLIFLTKYAKSVISRSVSIPDNNTIIPHGINPRYLSYPKPQKRVSGFSLQSPFKLLYVSILSPYKHQWNVAEAVCRLYSKGIPIHLTLVGPAEQESLTMLTSVLKKYANSRECIEYKGAISHDQLFKVYEAADSFIFASTCENLPIILIEAMSAGLPILCSSYGPMPEVLGHNEDMYFDPEDIDGIESKILELLGNRDVRDNMARSSYQKAVQYSWKDMTADTHRFLVETYRRKE